MPNGDNLTVTSPIGLWLTKGPSGNSGNIALLPDNTPVKALSFSDGWYKVNYEGTIGWLDAQYTSANGSNILQKPAPKPASSFTTHSVDGTVTVTCGGLWINSNPTPNDGNLIVVPHGTKLHATEESSNGWYKVTYKGQTGWIGGAPYSTFTQAPVQQPQTGTPVNKKIEVVAGGLCLNSSPKPNDGTILVLPHGAVVTATEESSNGWYKVTYNGKTGWIGGAPYSKVISSGQEPEAATPVNKSIQVVAGGLCLNTNPKPNDGTITVLPHGAIVHATEESSNGWYKVTYNGKTGWIGGAPYSKVVPTPSKTIKVVAGGLCLNTNPEPNDGIIAVLPHGAIVTSTEESSNGWYKVTYNGKTGWIGGSPYSEVISSSN